MTDQLIAFETGTSDVQHVAESLGKTLTRWTKGKAAETRRAYQTRVQQFTAWLVQQEPGQEPLAYLESYSEHLQANVSKRSAQAHLNTVKRAMQRAAAYGYMPAQAAANAALAEAPKVRGQIAGQRLTKVQRNKLLRTPGVDSAKGLRDTAILALLSVCGLRRSEVAALTWHDVQEVGGHYVVNIVEGKAGRDRSVKLPVWVWRALERYAVAADLWKADGVAVFVPINKGGNVAAGRGMSSQAIYKLVTRYCEAAAVPEIAPHDLRRTAAALARDGGASIEQVQHMLGHASPQTTSNYIGAQYSLDDNAVDYAKARPPKGLEK